MNEQCRGVLLSLFIIPRSYHPRMDIVIACAFIPDLRNLSCSYPEALAAQQAWGNFNGACRRICHEKDAILSEAAPGYKDTVIRLWSRWTVRWAFGIADTQNSFLRPHSCAERNKILPSLLHIRSSGFNGQFSLISFESTISTAVVWLAILSVCLQGSCILFCILILDPDRFDLVSGRRWLFSYTITTIQLFQDIIMYSRLPFS